MKLSKSVAFFDDALDTHTYDDMPDFELERGVFKELRNVSIPKTTMKYVLLQAKNAVYGAKKGNVNGFAVSCLVSDIEKVADRQRDNDESIYDSVKDVFDGYGMTGVFDVEHRKVIAKLAEFIVENDKEWKLTYGDKEGTVADKIAGKGKMVDNVNHPSHYSKPGEIECIDFITKMVAPYQGVVAGDLQNVMKYTWRCKNKNGKEDLKKAQWYANHAIGKIEEQMKDPTLLKRAMLTVDGFRHTEDEHDFIVKSVKQVEKELTPRERSSYEVIVGCIMEGTLYKDKHAIEVFRTAFDNWERDYFDKKDKSVFKPNRSAVKDMQNEK